MFCNWFWDFFLSGWNIFDLVVVLTSLISAVLGLSNIKSVRMLRALRVVRLVKQMQNLRIIVNAVVASIIPVAWAFTVCFMVVAVYAIMGQSFFGVFNTRARLVRCGVRARAAPNCAACGS